MDQGKGSQRRSWLWQESKWSTEPSKGIHPISIPINGFPHRTTNTTSNDSPTSNQPNKFRRCINSGDTIAVSGPIDPASGSVDPAEPLIIGLTDAFLPFTIFLPQLL